MFPEAKVYHDGSHYIAIPQKPVKKKRKALKEPEEKVAVTYTEDGVKPAKEMSENKLKDTQNDTDYLIEIGLIDEEEKEKKPVNKPINEQNEPVFYLSRTELFNKVYEENKHLKRSALKKKLVTALLHYFSDTSETELFVDDNLLRIRRNLNSKLNRAWRKARLADFNYFCTFTYDSRKNTEEDFKRKLSKTLRNLSVRKGWRYMGVWERGEKTARLHFHALVHVPDGAMVGDFEEVRDYNTEKHRMQTQLVNSYFGERFGRTTFEAIAPQELDYSLNYILKYIEKTGEKIVYSRGLYMYFLSDILDDDVIMKMTDPNPEYKNEKYILFDNFTCIDEGEIVGTASKDTIRKLRHTNK